MPEPVPQATAEPKKAPQSTPQAEAEPEFSLKDENATLKMALGQSRAVETKLRNKVKKLEVELLSQPVKRAEEPKPSPEPSQLKPEPVPAEAKGSRKNRSWPLPYCPGPEWCGDPKHHSKGAKNSDFKDEVECVDCHAPLGPEEDVKHRMESCPFCSSDRGYVARPGYELRHDRCQGGKCSVKA